MSAVSKQNMKKKRDGNAAMNFEKQLKYRNKLKENRKPSDAEKARKKEKDRLRYILKKEAKSTLSKNRKIASKLR